MGWNRRPPDPRPQPLRVAAPGPASVPPKSIRGQATAPCWWGRCRASTPSRAWRLFSRPSVQTAAAVGQVVIFRSVRDTFRTLRRNARSACAIGIRTDGRFGGGYLLGNGAARRLTREINPPQLLEAAALVALGTFRKSGRSDRFRRDAEGAQKAAELLGSERLPVSPFNPRSLRVSDEFGHKVDRANSIIITKRAADVGEEFDVARGRLVSLAREDAGCVPCPSRPVGAGKFRDR